MLPSPGPLSSGLPQSSPSLWGTPRLSLLWESSMTLSRVHRGGSDPLSSLLSQRRGSTLSLRQSVYPLSLPLSTDPLLTRTLHSCVSSGSHLVCLNCGFNKNSKDFLWR